MRVQKLETKLATPKHRVSALENIFYSNGVTKEQLDGMIK